MREPFSLLPGDLKPTLVFCRHVLEHLADPRPFVAELAAAALKPDVIVVMTRCTKRKLSSRALFPAEVQLA